jgi:hypothetical protein
MKRRVPHQALSCAYIDPAIFPLLTEVVDDCDGEVVIIPQVQQPVQEWPEFIGFILIGRAEHEIEWIEDQENWFDPLNVLHQCFLMILVAQIQPGMVDEVEI